MTGPFPHWLLAVWECPINFLSGSLAWKGISMYFQCYLVAVKLLSTGKVAVEMHLLDPMSMRLIGMVPALILSRMKMVRSKVQAARTLTQYTWFIVVLGLVLVTNSCLFSCLCFIFVLRLVLSLGAGGGGCRVVSTATLTLSLKAVTPVNSIRYLLTPAVTIVGSCTFLFAFRQLNLPSGKLT